jgi:hypothetical protein
LQPLHPECVEDEPVPLDECEKKEEIMRWVLGLWHKRHWMVRSASAIDRIASNLI